MIVKQSRRFYLSVLLAIASFHRPAYRLQTRGARRRFRNTAYFGRWDLTLKALTKNIPRGWKSAKRDGQLKAQFMGRWGNARPLPKAGDQRRRVDVRLPKGRRRTSSQDMVFTGSLRGQTLSGTLTGPKNGSWKWTGKRAPALKAVASPKWGKPVELFNGKDLSGWTTRPLRIGSGPSWMARSSVPATAQS